MSVLGAILMIVTGLAIMAFGLFLFYAWLPLLYGLVGLDIGLLIGRALTGDVGTLAIILGIVGAVALALASYFLEPYRRILLGVSGGFLLGLSLAAIFGLDSVFGRISGAILAVCRRDCRQYSRTPLFQYLVVDRIRSEWRCDGDLRDPPAVSGHRPI